MDTYIPTAEGIAALIALGVFCLAIAGLYRNRKPVLQPVPVKTRRNRHGR